MEELKSIDAGLDKESASDDEQQTQVRNEWTENEESGLRSYVCQSCGGKQAWDYPSYDHIFIKGGARADTFALLSYDCLAEMSDHYPIFADIAL